MNFPPPSPWQARVIWLAMSGLAVAVLVGLGVGLILGLSWRMLTAAGAGWARSTR